MISSSWLNKVKRVKYNRSMRNHKFDHDDSHIYDGFEASLGSYWTQVCTGGGSLHVVDSTVRMSFPSACQGRYTDAQIDDYTMLRRSAYPWKPPLRMTIRARSSSPTNVLRGTAGFGFWNNPFSLQGDILALPESIWFFYASPPSNMALVPGISGWGWKAQVVHTVSLRSLASVLPMTVATAFGRLTGNTLLASHWMQRMAGAHEALLSVDMTKWHTYILEWRSDQAFFWVDEKLVLQTSQPPTRPLGFVAWLDNQYAIATPDGIKRFGTVNSGPQWLEMDFVKIEQL